MMVSRRWRILVLLMMVGAWGAGGVCAQTTGHEKESFRLGVRVRLEGQTHAMGDLNTILSNQADAIEANVGVSAEVVESYPVRPSISVEGYGWIDVGTRFGVNIGYVETGGRVDYRDFSGRLTFDHTVTRWVFGPFVERRFYRRSGSFPLMLWGTLGTRYSRSTVKMTSQISVNGESNQSEILNVDVTSYGIVPGLAVESGYGPITARLVLAAEIAFDGNMKTEEGQVQVDGEDARVDWTGIRGGVSIGVEFPLPK